MPSVRAITDGTPHAENVAKDDLSGQKTGKVKDHSIWPVPV